MPSLLPEPCLEIGCNKPRAFKSARCEEHTNKRPTLVRPTYHKLYNTKQWRIMRNNQLYKEPLCQCCLGAGVVRSAVHVDHIVKHEGDYTLFSDPSNLQSLCASCHSVKTVKESSGEFVSYKQHSLRSLKQNQGLGEHELPCFGNSRNPYPTV